MIVGSERVRTRHRQAGLWGDRLLHHPCRGRARTIPKSVAMVRVDATGPTAWSWNDLDRSSSALAAQFLDIGLKQDAAVAYLGTDIARFAISLLAMSKCGQIIIPVSPLASARALADVFEAGDVRAIVIDDPGLVDLAYEAAALAAGVRFLLGFSTGKMDGVVAIDETALRSGDAGDLTGIPPRASDPGDHCLTLSFGETEAAGRVFARSHNQWRSAGELIADQIGVTSKSRVLCPFLPSSAAAQFGAISPWLVKGGTLVVTKPMSPCDLVRAINLVGVTHCLAPSAFETAMLRHLRAEEDREPVQLISVKRAGEISAPGGSNDLDAHPGKPVNIARATAIGSSGLLFHSLDQDEQLPLGVVSRKSGDSDFETPSLLETQIRGVAELAQTLPRSGLVRGELALSGAAVPATYCIIESGGKLGLRLVSDLALTRIRAGVVSIDPLAFEVVGRMDGAVQVGGTILDVAAPASDSDDDESEAETGPLESGTTASVVPDPLLGSRLVPPDTDLDQRTVALRNPPTPSWVQSMIDNEPARDAAARATRSRAEILARAKEQAPTVHHHEDGDAIITDRSEIEAFLRAALTKDEAAA